MFDFEDANLDKLVVHRVGNKAQNEGVIISNELCDIYNELTENMLKRYFLEPFGKVNTIYKFKLYHIKNKNQSNKCFLTIKGSKKVAKALATFLLPFIVKKHLLL